MNLHYDRKRRPEGSFPALQTPSNEGLPLTEVHQAIDKQVVELCQIHVRRVKRHISGYSRHPGRLRTIVKDRLVSRESAGLLPIMCLEPVIT